jgi:hypothetical protein
MSKEYNFAMRELKMNHRVKKQWKQPTLIRLVRGSREERVLAACKVPGGMSGPLSAFNECSDGDCGLCSTQTPS